MVADPPSKCVLYVFDSLRCDHLSCYGYGGNTTPTLDRLAGDGVRFENAFAQGIWTFPSAATIFSGLYPETHGSHQFEQPLDEGFPHLADGLTDTDVATACFSTTLGISPERGYEQGFDDFYHLGRDGDALRPDIADRLNEVLIPWIEDHADGPFFVVVWVMTTHHPFLTPETAADPSRSITSDPTIEGSAGWLRRQPREEVDRARELYDDAITYSDDALGELIETLDRHGVYDETTVIATADHGELFDEHARLEHTNALVRKLLTGTLSEERLRTGALVTPPAWLGHQAVFPYDELIHVPLLLKPGARSVDRDSFDGLVELVDIYPTIRETLGVGTDRRVQGTSLYEFLAGKASKEYVYSTSQVHNGNLAFRSVRSHEYKLCREELVGLRRNSDPWGRSLKLLASYLLNRKEILLRIDGGGEYRVTDPLRRRELLAQLREHVDRRNRERTAFEEGTARVEVDEETERQLADLGYG